MPVGACCTEQAGVGLLLGEQKDSSIVSVKQVVPRGSADRTNRIRVGDQVAPAAPLLSAALPQWCMFRCLHVVGRAGSLPSNEKTLLPQILRVGNTDATGLGVTELRNLIIGEQV